jgi:hypothetical protein
MDVPLSSNSRPPHDTEAHFVDLFPLFPASRWIVNRYNCAINPSIRPDENGFDETKTTGSWLCLGGTLETDSYIWAAHTYLPTIVCSYISWCVIDRSHPSLQRSWSNFSRGRSISEIEGTDTYDAKRTLPCLRISFPHLIGMTNWGNHGSVLSYPRGA